MEDKNSPELTREELLALITETTKKTKAIQAQIDKLSIFYKENLVDEGEHLSNQTIFKNVIVKAGIDQQILKEVKEEAEKFKNETLVGTEENPSTRKVINEALIDIKAKREEIVSAHKLLLESEEGRESIKAQILNVKIDVDQFKTETLIGIDGKESTKASLNNLVAEATALIADSQKLNTGIESKHTELIAAQKLLLEDEEGRDSVKTQIIKIKDDFNKNLTENEKEVKKLRSFYKAVFEKVVDEETETEGLGLKATVESLANRLGKLTTDAEQKLLALTDSSLHNAFAERAKEYTKEFQTLENKTLNLTNWLIADIVAFGVAQLILLLCGKEFNYHLLIYQFSIAGALIFAIWMLNRNQKIAKKLAEEYHHKASIAAAMTGYRELYSLEHKDAEYMELFNSLRDQLNTNPSKGIDTFLKLKSPHEEISDSIKNVLKPENIKIIANEVTELIKEKK
ncbi:MAG: hypothetical protein ACJ77K_10380 [Bacteroidia bacterium]